MTFSSQPPPPGSKPEAADLPTETYKMSEDPSLFRAPKYPEPPKNMYYQVPENPPAPESKPPPPIFPWEEDAPKATRIFLEDVPAPAPPPETLPEPVPPQPATSATTGEEQASPASPTASTSTAPPTRSFEEYSRTNAWDDVPEINRYISRLPQNRRGKLQILFNKAPQTFVNTKYEPLISPPVPVDNPIADSLDIPAAQRLTDFPTEIERPSLPVTPAPVRRPSFWGSERDKAGDLPGAEDVPEVSEWDPAEKLKELVQRHSEALERGEVPASAIGLGGPQNSSEGELPRRKDIASASVLPEPRTSGVPQEDPVPKTEDKPDINTEEGVEKEEVPLAVESSIVSDSAIAAAAATSAEDTAIEAALPNAATAITAAAEA